MAEQAARVRAKEDAQAAEKERQRAESLTKAKQQREQVRCMCNPLHTSISLKLVLKCDVLKCDGLGLCHLNLKIAPVSHYLLCTSLVSDAIRAKEGGLATGNCTI